MRFQYPDCDVDHRVPSPVERFYRVFEDRIAVAERPDELDDAQFTTNVEESELTRASYLGSGSGYGSRVVLTGGLDAATFGALSGFRSLCGRDDRELLAGSVGKVEVSDQSTTAEAAALDADVRTQEIAGDPVSRCKPQAPPDTDTGQEWNRCSTPDTEEVAFDEERRTDKGEPVDENKDDCDDRDGANRYAARCLGEEGAKANEGFDSQKAVPRDGFRAAVACDAAHDEASGEAEGALGDARLDEAAKPAVGTEPPLRVARSSSTVTVTREAGRGVTVKVDSWARGIEIPGVGSIGVVRGEATSVATGLDGRAKGTYTRTICDVRMGETVVPGCVGEGQAEALVKSVNDALGGRAELRLRRHDEILAQGSRHGYLAAVQRDRRELFGDQVINRDRSLAVPALEIVLYQGDGGAWGAGRQLFQFAGVQASTSYGIACLYGEASEGRCAGPYEGGPPPGPEPTGGGGTEVVYVYEDPPPDDGYAVDGGDESGGGLVQRVVRLVRRVPEAVAQAIRLLFNNPRELGLLAAVWALLYAPCWLGERRRSIAGLRARRVGIGGVT